MLAFFAASLNAGLMTPMAMNAAMAAAHADEGGEMPPCDDGDHGQMALRDCMAMCASSIFMLPRAEVMAIGLLPSERPDLPVLRRAGLEVPPEPHPPKRLC